VARIKGVDPEQVDPASKAAFAAQTERWGAPLLAHLLYARRPTIYRGARAMWSGLHQSGLLDPALVALVNRRVAGINGCVF
jgi:alkylhydroperoxidase family enzyme